MNDCLFFSEKKKEEWEDILARISDICTPTPMTTLQLYHQQKKNDVFIPTGISRLDEYLKGGFQKGQLSELVGRAGVGKTQMALQLCIANNHHMNGGCIYIDTERKLSLSRLQQMTQQQQQQQQQQKFNKDGHAMRDEKAILYNFTIHTPNNLTELMLLFTQQTLEEEILASTVPITMVVLDSIAASIKRDFDRSTAHERVTTVFEIAQRFKRLADEFKVAIIIINQIDHEQDATVTASLGTSWHHCISTRILLEHTMDPHSIPNEIPNVRTATVVKSNVSGHHSISFEITTSGVSETIHPDDNNPHQIII